MFKKIGIFDEIIYILFCEWYVEKNYVICANIYCSNYVVENKDNYMTKYIQKYPICSNICDIQYNIQYILKNDIYHYDDDENINSHIYDSICKLTNEQKNNLCKKYPLYFSFSNGNYTPFYY